MKNKVILIAFVFVLVFVLSSCGEGKQGNSSTTDPQADNTVSSEVQASESVSGDNEASADPSGSIDDAEASENTESASPTSDAPTQEPSQKPTETVPDISSTEFSFKIGNVRLTLREHNLDAKLAKLPLELTSDNTEVLGEGNDTFTGSSLRTVTYNGLEIMLFAPKDDNDNFWLLKMSATAPEVVTNRGVKVGDSVQTLLDKYPEAENLLVDGEESYAYAESEADSYEELTFAISGDEVSMITLTFYMP